MGRLFCHDRSAIIFDDKCAVGLLLYVQLLWLFQEQTVYQLFDWSANKRRQGSVGTELVLLLGCVRLLKTCTVSSVECCSGSTWIKNCCPPEIGIPLKKMNPAASTKAPHSRKSELTIGYFHFKQNNKLLLNGSVLHHSISIIKNLWS